MIKYVNEELKISIEVPEKYTFVDKKYYDKIGLDKTAQEQTVFMFIDTKSTSGENFNVTRDAVYASDEEAITKGIDANVENLTKQGYSIVSKENFVSKQGKNCVKIITLYDNKVYVNLLFTTLDGLLLCLGYANAELNVETEMVFEQILSTIAKA